jgi:hypothetical protein
MAGHATLRANQPAFGPTTMNLSPWRIVGLVILAVLLLAVAVLDASAPAVPPSCSAADGSRTHGLVTQAQEEYVAILAKEPASSCARKGMERAGAALCRLGNQIVEGGGDVAAARLYSSILFEQPLSALNRNCAVRGLRSAHAQTGSVVYPCPAHAGATQGTCTVTVGIPGAGDKGGKPRKSGGSWSANVKHNHEHRHCKPAHRRTAWPPKRRADGSP